MVKLLLKCRLIYLSQGTPGEVNVHSWAGKRAPPFPPGHVRYKLWELVVGWGSRGEGVLGEIAKSFQKA